MCIEAKAWEAKLVSANDKADDAERRVAEAQTMADEWRQRATDSQLEAEDAEQLQASLHVSAIS